MHFEIFFVLSLFVVVIRGDQAGETFCEQFDLSSFEGYYCSNDFSGYYICLQGDFASQSAFESCALGTTCICPFGKECTSYTNGQSPCSVNPCANADFSSGVPIRCSGPSSGSCGGFGSYCLNDIDANIGRCAGLPVVCTGEQACSHNSDCPTGYFCASGSYCGSGGFCFPLCL